MKKQDIRIAYTQKVTEFLNQGYTIFPDTMNGSQGEIAHIDLTDGNEILRVLLRRERLWSHIEEGFHGDAVILTVGRAASDTRVGDTWHGTIWNNRLEDSSEIQWAEIRNRGEGWYTALDEAARIGHIRRERRLRRGRPRTDKLGTAYKLVALHWLRRQPKMKSCRLEDIEEMVRFWDCDGKRVFAITAKGKRYIIE